MMRGLIERFRPWRHARILEGVETYCMFLGYPRSGHSLIGSLLDAHPNAIIAHELDALQAVDRGCAKHELFNLLIRNSQEFTAAGRKWEGYEYGVPNQWNGRFTRLKVIGDKKGSHSVALLREKPDLLDRLRPTVGIPVKFIHVVRNPYDNIATISQKSPSLEDPAAAARFYFERVETVLRLRNEIDRNDWFELRHEVFVADPRGNLAALCRFLELKPSAAYLRDCASIVFASPRRTRMEVVWTPDLLRHVQGRIDAVDYLAGYAFSSEETCVSS